jgi:hypothetical protein
MNLSRWNLISRSAIIAGASAWLIKLAAILASDGKETVSGLPALFYLVGLLLLAGGVAGILSRLTAGRPFMLRFAVTLLAPPAFFSTFLTLDFLIKPVIPNGWPDYAKDEAGIAVTAVVWLVVGLGLLFSPSTEGRPA